jgi:hypothetical protein
MTAPGHRRGGGAFHRRPLTELIADRPTSVAYPVTTSATGVTETPLLIRCLEAGAA